MTDSKPDAPGDEPAPFGRSWATLYILVLANLAFWIVAFWAFTRALQ